MAAAAPSAGETALLVLLPSLGTTAALWDGVVHLLAGASSTRILRVDLPGHGSSPVAREPFGVDELATAVLALVDEVGGGAFHVAGDSLGGAVALELAVVAPDRVRSLTMFCSGAVIGTPEGWRDRAAQVRAAGTASLVAGSAERWFAPGYLEGHPDGPGGSALRALVDVDDESYALCCEALAAYDRTGTAPAVRAPALMVAGAHDRVSPPARIRALAEKLPEARFVEVADAAHLVPLEDPTAAAALLSALLSALVDRAGPRALLDRGMSVRREVLGDDHVARAAAAIIAETADFQDFITRYAWGEVWSRPQLGRDQRSIATLASLVTGGHTVEIRMHVRAALRNGLTRTEIAEVIQHTAIYAGLPAANSALALMREVFLEETNG